MKIDIVLILFVLNFFCSYSQTPLNDPHWQEVWRDDFNVLDSDPQNPLSKWIVKNNFDDNNKNQAVYIDDNVECVNGNLVITTKIEQYSCDPLYVEPNWFCVRQYETGNPYSFTSGWIESRQPYNIQFGYIEARINMPYNHLLWPSFWTFLGDGVTNNTNGAEIDIIELRGSDPNDRITTNVHYAYCGSGTPQNECNELQAFNDNYAYKEIKPDNFSYANQWHKYAVEWSPSKIIWYIDDIPVRKFDMANNVDPITGQPVYPIDPIRLILAVGVSLDQNMIIRDFTAFPKQMLVDYVAVYELQNDCSNTVQLCDYWFPYWDNKVKNEIFIGNGTCYNFILSGQDVNLRASEGITISGDFYIEQGADVYMDVNNCY